MRCHRRATRFILAAVVIGVCRPAVSGQQNTEADGDELRKRVTAYWDARIARSPHVYDFYPAPELGGPKDMKMVGELGNVLFESYQITSIDREGDSATVHLEVRTHVTPMHPGGAKEGRYALPAVDTWNRICGTWYRKPVRRSLARRDFEPSELGSVGADGPDCTTAGASVEKAEQGGAPAESESNEKAGP